MPPRSGVLFSCSIVTAHRYLAAFVRERGCMRTLRPCVVLVPCLLAIATLAEGQLPHLFEAAKSGPPHLPFKIIGVPMQGAGGHESSEDK